MDLRLITEWDKLDPIPPNQARFSDAVDEFSDIVDRLNEIEKNRLFHWNKLKSPAREKLNKVEAITVSNILDINYAVHFLKISKPDIFDLVNSGILPSGRGKKKKLIFNKDDLIKVLEYLNDYKDSNLSLKKAAEYLNCTKDHIYLNAKIGNIPYHRNGTLPRFKKSDLDEWKESLNSQSR